MKRTSYILFTLTLLGGIAGSILLTPASSLAQSKSSKSTKKGPDTWAVVQVGDDIKVIHTGEINGAKKKVTDDYNAAMKKYTEEKRSNPKADKPVKVKFSVLRRGIKSEEEADDFRDKKLDEADKKAEAKTDSKGRR